MRRGNSRVRSAPRPAPVRNSPRPASHGPRPAPGRSLFRDLGSAIAEGMAYRMGERAADAVLAPPSNHETINVCHPGQMPTDIRTGSADAFEDDDLNNHGTDNSKGPGMYLKP